jgi:hypothetical protein
MRGKMMRIIDTGAGDEPSVPLPSGDVMTIFVVRNHAATPTAAACVTSEPETWTAFAILLGQPPDAPGGWQVLADRNAWLRAAWHPGEPGDWDNPQTLIARIRDINDRPLAVTLPGGHVHAH